MDSIDDLNALLPNPLAVDNNDDLNALLPKPLAVDNNDDLKPLRCTFVLKSGMLCLNEILVNRRLQKD